MLTWPDFALIEEAGGTCAIARTSLSFKTRLTVEVAMAG